MCWFLTVNQNEFGFQIYFIRRKETIITIGLSENFFGVSFLYCKYHFYFQIKLFANEVKKSDHFIFPLK